MGISIGQGLLAGSEGVAGGFIEGRKNIARDLEANALASQNTIENALERDKETRLSAKSILDASQQKFENHIEGESLKVDQGNLKLAVDQFELKTQKEAHQIELWNKMMELPTGAEPSIKPSDVKEPAVTKDGLIQPSNVRLPTSTNKSELPSKNEVMQVKTDNLVSEADRLEGEVSRLEEEWEVREQMLIQGGGDESSITRLRVNSGAKIKLAQDARDHAFSKARFASTKTKLDLDSEIKRNELRDYEDTKSSAGEMINGILEDVDGILDGIAGGTSVFGEWRGSAIGQSVNAVIGFAESLLGTEIVEGYGQETKVMRSQMTRVQGEQILSKIKTAKFGQLSEGERKFIERISINPDEPIESVVKQLKRLKRILTLGKDRYNFVQSIKDPALKKQVKEDVTNLSNPHDFNMYKRQFLDANPDRVKYATKTVSTEGDAVDTTGWTESQFEELRGTGTRIIHNGKEGFID